MNETRAFTSMMANERWFKNRHAQPSYIHTQTLTISLAGFVYHATGNHIKWLPITNTIYRFVHSHENERKSITIAKMIFRFVSLCQRWLPFNFMFIHFLFVLLWIVTWLKRHCSRALRYEKRVRETVRDRIGKTERERVFVECDERIDTGVWRIVRRRLWCSSAFSKNKLRNAFHALSFYSFFVFRVWRTNVCLIFPFA